MRRYVLLTLVTCFAASASAQSITSFEPDSTSRPQGAPPGMVDIPVCFGFQLSPVTGPSSTFEDRELSTTHCSPWFGATATWPWRGPQQGWFDLGYQHWEFVDAFDALPPFSLDLFTLRGGVDQLLWSEHRVFAAIGGGIGIGGGWAQEARVGASDRLMNGELIAHAFVFLKLNSNTRVGIGGSGVASWQYTSGGGLGPWQHLELAFRLDQALRVPKRIVPGL